MKAKESIHINELVKGMGKILGIHKGQAVPKVDKKKTYK